MRGEGGVTRALREGGNSVGEIMEIIRVMDIALPIQGRARDKVGIIPNLVELGLLTQATQTSGEASGMKVPNGATLVGHRHGLPNPKMAVAQRVGIIPLSVQQPIGSLVCQGAQPDHRVCQP